MTQTKAELLQTRHQGDIRLGDADSTHYVGFKAPATVGTSLVWTLPAADGTAGYYLKTDGSGNLGWSLDNSGVSLSGSTNNTVATVTGANALQGEANLVFDGSKLGIGTTTPDNTLHVHKGSAGSASSDNNSVLTVENSSHSILQMLSPAANSCRIMFGDPDSVNSGEVNYDHNIDAMLIKVNGSERMRMHSGGEISKGTTLAREQVHFHYDSSDENYLRFTNSTTGTAAGDGFNVGISASEQALVWHKESEAMVFGVGNTERMRIETTGQLLVGTSSSIAFWGQTNRLQVIGTDWSTSGLTIGKLGNNTNAPNLVFGISRGSSVGTIVQNGDPVGQINWNADDGTDVNSTVAAIKARIDGTPGANDTPGKLEFHTTADGAASTTERLSINSTGIFKFTGVITQVATAAGALDLNLNTSNYFTKTISGNSTFTFSNPAASGTVTAFTLELTHSSGTVTWPSSVKWNADTAPTLTTGKTHLFMFVTDDGGTRYRGSALVDYVN
jgi:hypothetical protein